MCGTFHPGHSVYISVEQFKHSKDTYFRLCDLKGMGKRVIGVPTPSPTWSLREVSLTQIFLESWTPCRESGSSVSTACRSFVLSIYWDIWHGGEGLLLDPYQRIPVNHSWRGSQSNKRSEDQQGSGADRISNRALKHFPNLAVSFFLQVLNSVLHTLHILQAWKHAQVIYILKQGKNPALSSSHRTSSLFDKIGKLFEMILLATIWQVVSKWGLMW